MRFTGNRVTDSILDPFDYHPNRPLFGFIKHCIKEKQPCDLALSNGYQVRNIFLVDVDPSFTWLLFKPDISADLFGVRRIDTIVSIVEIPKYDEDETS